MAKKLYAKFQFSAAHYIPNHPKCGVVHGHTYKVEIFLEGELSKGMLIDYGVLKEMINNEFDHRLLNDFIEVPTLENIAIYIIDRIKKLRKFSKIKVKCWEGDNLYAEIDEVE